MKFYNIKKYIKNNKSNIISLSFAIFFLSFGMTIHRYFGVTEVEQVIFHMENPLQGVDGRLVSGFFRHSILQPVVIIAVSLLIFSAYPSIGKRIHSLSLALWILGVVRLFSCFTGYAYFSGYISSDDPSDDFYRERVVQPEISSITFSEKRNLVVLYLESLEASFGDRQIFPVNLLPRLSQWRERHAFVRDAFQAHDTGWTIAGIVSSWSGLPLRAGAGAKNNSFMPGIVMVPDVLARHGYNLKYIQGTSLYFTGKNLLFLTHGFAPEQIVGLETVLEKHPDWMPRYHGPADWGLRDSVTYQMARKSLMELSRENKPFALFMLTVNPHFSKGFVEPGWNGPEIEELDQEQQAYADVVTNADMLASEFLHWLSEQDFADSTTVVVLSDHFVMGTALAPFLNEQAARRRNLNIVINAARPLNATGRAISQFDWAPTMLEAVGARIPGGRMGLGVSLFSERRTLVEEMGIEKLNDELRAYSPYYVDIAMERQEKEGAASIR